MWVLQENVESNASTFDIFPFDIFIFGLFPCILRTVHQLIRWMEGVEIPLSVKRKRQQKMAACGSQS